MEYVVRMEIFHSQKELSQPLAQFLINEKEESKIGEIRKILC